MDTDNVTFFVMVEDLDSLFVLIACFVKTFDSIDFSHSLFRELEINNTWRLDDDHIRLFYCQIMQSCLGR